MPVDGHDRLPTVAALGPPRSSNILHFKARQRALFAGIAQWMHNCEPTNGGDRGYPDMATVAQFCLPRGRRGKRDTTCEPGAIRAGGRPPPMLERPLSELLRGRKAPLTLAARHDRAHDACLRMRECAVDAVLVADGSGTAARHLHRA